MSKDLTSSPVDRQNILNNDYALVEVEKAIGIKGIPFEEGTVVLKEQVADFLEVTTRTAGNYLERFGAELTGNGYEVIRGKRLQELKLRLSESDAHETDFASIQKVSQLGVFRFRAFLNLAMVVAESERARLLRQLVLDIVIDTINQRTGGRTKYINQRDEEFYESENISYHVAAGRISRELLGDWMLAVLTGQVDDESLKLRIFNAISEACDESQ